MSPPAASTAAARTVAPPAPRPRRLKAAGVPARTSPGRVSRPPRRVSGPSRTPARNARQAPRPRRPASPQPAWRQVAGGAAAAAMRLPDHRLLDRLVRGRYWIGLVGAALIGMVAMQVAMLRINSNIGGYVEKAANLERANSVLSADISRLATVSRIEAEGARLGLVLPHADGIRYRYARPETDAANAVQTMRAPSPAAPVTQTATPPAQTQATTTLPAGGTVSAGTTPVTGAGAAGATTGTVAQSPTQPQETSPSGP